MDKCNYISLMFMILAVLLIVMLPELNKAIPNIHLLFNDNINFIMLMIITICILLLDIPSGIMFSLFVIYGSYYYQKINFTNLISNKTYQDHSVNFKPLLPSAGDVETSMLRLPTEHGLLESFTNINTQNTNNEDVNTQIQKQAQYNTINYSSDKDNINTQNTIKDIIVKSRSGYDVVGCRMDCKKMEQNTTIYGPPLSSNEYIKDNGKNITGWYPLNI